jgi:hypothetical protein
VTLNADLIRSRCTEIEESIRRLESIARLPLDEFLADQDTLDIACYRLLVAIEAALALCYHVSARRLRQAPEATGTKARVEGGRPRPRNHAAITGRQTAAS